MSFVNVGVFGASAAPAPRGSASATVNAHAPIATLRVVPFQYVMFVLPLHLIGRSLDGHFHIGVGPAALKAAAALARFIVGLHPQQIVARRVERRRRADHFALLRGRKPRLLELHLPRAAELMERDGRNRSGEPKPAAASLGCRTWRLRIFDPDADRDRLVHDASVVGGNADRWTGHFRATL